MKFARIILVALSLSGALALAQLPGRAQRPWTGPEGLREPVARIMDRQAVSLPHALIIKTQEDEGPDRERLPQNPASAKTSTWPLLSVKESAKVPGEEKAEPIGPAFGTSTSFTGGTISESGFVPPDTMGDVSPTQILMAINGRIKVFDRNGVVGALNADLNVFFDSVRAGQYVSDPRAKWDRASGRWIVVAINVAPNDNLILIAVSDTGTISAATVWTFYGFPHSAVAPVGDSTYFFDYPTLGVDRNALYIGGNVFNPYFYNTTAFVVRKSSVLSGGPVVATAFRAMIGGSGDGIYTPQGVDNDDPASTDGYLIGVSSAYYGKLIAKRISDPAGTPTLSADVPITVPATSAPLNVAAKSSIAPLDGLDDRLLAAKVQLEQQTGLRTLWTAHNIKVNSSGVAVSGNRNAVRWYQLGDLAGSFSVIQSGTAFDPAASTPKSFWMGTVAQTLQGHAAMGGSYSNSTIYASTARSYRFAEDALGSSITPIKTASGVAGYSLQSGKQRWGDYSQTVVDPLDGMSVWTFQEYVSAANTWAVRIAKLKAPAPPAIASIAPSSVAKGTALTLVVTGTAGAGKQFFDPGAGYTKHLAAGVTTGGGVIINSITIISRTQVNIAVTVSPGATAGPRTLKITNPDGQYVTASFSVV